MKLTYQYKWDAAEVVIKGNAYHQMPVSKKEKSQINNLSFHIKKLDKEEHK